jgi:hypothetical protein
MLKKYTYGIYMIGNYDLANYVERDLKYKLGGSISRGSNNKNNVVCYASYYCNNKILNYLYYGRGNNYQFFDNKKKIDKMSLDSYLYFIKNNFISEYYVLTLWGHGYTWIENVPFYNKNMARFENNDLYKIKQSLSKYKIDILVFETCAGMSIETIYELRKYTKYICGNCDYTGYDGISHENMIKCTNSPNLFCKKIVNNMKNELCPSYIQTKNINFIYNKLNKIIILTLKKCSHEKILKIKKKIKKNIIDDISIDLGCFLHYMLKYCNDNIIKKKIKILQKFMKKKIYCVQKKKFKKYDCCGINIYFPRKSEEYLYMRNKYRMLEFNKNNAWIQFLDLIYKDDIKKYIESFPKN